MNWGIYYATENKEEAQYDVISGISGGSINTGAMSIFAKGDEENMLNTISTFCQDLSTDSIFKFWRVPHIFLPLVNGLKHSGFVNTEPLGKFMTSYFEKYGWETKRRIDIGGVDAITGNFYRFNETVSKEELVNAVCTSSSIPGAFKTWDWNYRGTPIIGIDGGSAYMTDITGAIVRCRELVDDESKITVDIVDAMGGEGPNGTPAQGEKLGNALENWLRYLELKDYYDGAADIVEAMAAYPTVNFRHYVTPGQSMGLISLMDGTNSTCTYPM